MNTYEYSLITITQISQEAKIGRKTFYRYFKNKNEVLEKHIEHLYLDYSSYIENFYSKKMSVLIYNHFSFWENHIDFLMMMYKNNLMFYIYKQYQIHCSLLNNKIIDFQNHDKITSTYINAYTAGVFWSFLYTWVENGARETPSQLAEICTNMIDYRIQ